jgi:serine/threonine protein kinase
VLSRLGQGASGIVYKALDLVDLRLVALKVSHILTSLYMRGRVIYRELPLPISQRLTYNTLSVRVYLLVSPCVSLPLYVCICVNLTLSVSVSVSVSVLISPCLCFVSALCVYDMSVSASVYLTLSVLCLCSVCMICLYLHLFISPYLYLCMYLHLFISLCLCPYTVCVRRFSSPFVSLYVCLCVSLSR